MRSVNPDRHGYHSRGEAPGMVSGLGGVSQRSTVIADLEKRPRIASTQTSGHFCVVPPPVQAWPGRHTPLATSAPCRGRVEAPGSGLIQRQLPATKA